MVPETQPKEISRFIVDIWVTGLCNMKCPFCYGADVPIKHSNSGFKREKVHVYSPTNETVSIVGTDIFRPEISLEQTKQIIKKLKQVGVNTLNISGGEPLLRNDTPEIIKFANEQGLDIYLSTNGTFLLQKLKLINGYISTIGLPLDGSSSETNIAMGRNKQHFENIKSILRYFYHNPPSFQLKIGTVVSKINIQELEKIAEILFCDHSSYVPDVWRIYQFESIKGGAKTKNLYEITNEDFLQVCSQVEAKFPDKRISPRTKETHSNAYFFVTPDGILQTVEEEHKSIADLLTIDINTLSEIMNHKHRFVVNKADQNRKWLEK